MSREAQFDEDPGDAFGLSIGDGRRGQWREGAECRTVSAFAAAFKRRHRVLVNSCLYGVITASDPAPTHPYPEGFGKAWLSGYRTLASILEFKHEKGAACGLTDQTLQMAGFPRPFDGAPYQLHVIDGCALAKKGHVIAIPTLAEWVRELVDEHQIEVPMPVFRKLADAGRDFTSATGCTGGTDPETQKPLDALAASAEAGFPTRTPAPARRSSSTPTAKCGTSAHTTPDRLRWRVSRSSSPCR